MSSSCISLPSDWEEVFPAGTPSSQSWKLPLMFKHGNNGVMYLWQIGFDGSSINTLYGTTETCSVDTTPVTIGNQGRNINEQALLQARAKYKNKFYDGYVQMGSDTIPMTKGMKGYPYKPGVVDGKTWMASPKLNGIRLLCTHNGGTSIVTKTYLNRVYKHFKLIEQQLYLMCAYLDSRITFDGELYTHGMSFYDICSAVKTEKFDHPDLPKINYCIFDYCSEENPHAEERYTRLYQSYKQVLADGGNLDNIKLVPQTLITTDREAIMLKDRYVSEGFEGLVIRRAAGNSLPGSKEFDLSKYKTGRSTRLYKIKNFIDEEGTIIGVKAADGKEKDLALLVVKDKSGIVTNIRHGNAVERAQWLQNPQLVVGRQFTFKYFERGPQGAPIQPTGVGFRDYE